MTNINPQELLAALQELCPGITLQQILDKFEFDGSNRLVGIRPPKPPRLEE